MNQKCGTGFQKNQNLGTKYW